MAHLPRILVFAGSNRSGSINGRLAGAITKQLASMQCEVNRITLRDYEMPIYDGDLESQHGQPDAAFKLARLFHEHDAVIIVSPEYNSSITPLLKNTIDWISRISSDQQGKVSPYRDRIFAIAAASNGGYGGMRGLFHLRDILVTLGGLVLPQQLAVARFDKVFDADENLTDERSASMMENLCRAVVEKATLLGRQV